MIFEKFQPSQALENIVQEYWIYESQDPSIHQQKIIPDGFSEIIIHYGDPYRINLEGDWKQQEKLLFSNQISSYFFLENMGVSGMIGIKLHPVSFYELFETDMTDCTDQVIHLPELIPDQIDNMLPVLAENLNYKERVNLVESWLLSLKISEQRKVREAVDQIIGSRGIIDIESIANENGVSTRQLERLFKKVVGVSPKFYARIIRSSNIFKVMDSDDQSWVKVALKSGYFDQSHFIKNFKEFTGEEPSNYGFDEKNLANFFLKR